MSEKLSWWNFLMSSSWNKHKTSGFTLLKILFPCLCCFGFCVIGDGELGNICLFILFCLAEVDIVFKHHLLCSPGWSLSQDAPILNKLLFEVSCMHDNLWPRKKELKGILRNFLFHFFVSGIFSFFECNYVIFLFLCLCVLCWSSI